MADTSLIQKLRDTTGAGVMECKRALDDARGEFDAAAALIRKRGFAKIEKRGDRATGAGLIESYVHNERIGVLLDLRAETDFVVRSDPFRALAREVAMQISAMAPATVDDLLAQEYIRDPQRTVEELIKETSSRVGENIKVNRFMRMEL